MSEGMSQQSETSSGSRPHEHRSYESVGVCHLFLQAPQCPGCAVWKRFSRDLCCQGRSKPDYRIVGSSTQWILTTRADIQLFLQELLMSVGFLVLPQWLFFCGKLCGYIRKITSMNLTFERIISNCRAYYSLVIFSSVSTLKLKFC